MNPILLLLLLQAAPVTVAPGPENNCPSSTRVAAALTKAAPNLVATQADESPSSELTLVLAPALATGEISFFLVDKNGRVKLYRTLPSPTGDRARDCVALADTVAFIVERYFSELALPALPEQTLPQASPLPGPPIPSTTPPKDMVATPPSPSIVVSTSPGTPGVDSPRFALSLTGGSQFPSAAGDVGGYQAEFTAGMVLTRIGGRGRVALEAAAGQGASAHRQWPGGNAALRRYLGELAILLGYPVGRGRLYAGPALSMNLLQLDADLNSLTQHETRLGWAAGARAEFQLPLSERIFLRLDASACAALVRYLFTPQSNTNSPIFSTPTVSVVVSAGAGVTF